MLPAGAGLSLTDRGLCGSVAAVFALRIAITLAILIPYWLIRQPRDTVEIFVVAFVAFGADIKAYSGPIICPIHC